MQKLVMFHIDEQQFALSLDHVDRIIPIIETRELPRAPEHVIGTINLSGELLPVISMRKLFLIPCRDFELTDQLIIVNTKKIKFALWVDQVAEVLSANESQLVPNDKVFIENELVEGLVQLNNNRILISDPDKFLTNEQIEKLKDMLIAKA